MSSVLVSGSFDDLRSLQVRFLHEASRFGPVHVLLWSDDQVSSVDGSPPRFPLEERSYLLEALRCVHRISVSAGPFDPDTVPGLEDLEAEVWAVGQKDASPARRAFAAAHGLKYRVILDRQLQGFPPFEEREPAVPAAPESPGERLFRLAALRACAVLRGSFRPR
jgi:hypothetical protein